MTNLADWYSMSAEHADLSERVNAAFQRGVSRGYDAANYANAYGETVTYDDVIRVSADVYPADDDYCERVAFGIGYADGVRQYDAPGWLIVLTAQNVSAYFGF